MIRIHRERAIPSHIHTQSTGLLSGDRRLTKWFDSGEYQQSGANRDVKPHTSASLV